MIFFGPVLPCDVWFDRMPRGVRENYVLEPMCQSDVADRNRRQKETRDHVIAMARQGAHGREIRDYLIDNAPLRTDPAAYITLLVSEKAIVQGSCDPYPDQYAGGNYGNPICHPTHFRYWAP